MEGFKTGRAIVIDDDPKEAMPIIRALGKLNIALHYSDGTHSVSKINGARLLCIDMVMGELGATVDDPTTCLSILMDALKSILGESTDPLVIICWTKAKELITDFREAFIAEFPSVIVRDIISMDKPAMGGDIDQIADAIQAHLSEFEPLNILFRWEQAVHSAATRTTSNISQIIRELEKGEYGRWSDCGYHICAALTIAERGTRVGNEDGEMAVKSFFNSLAPLLSDSLEHMPITTEAVISNNLNQAIRKILSDRKGDEVNQRKTMILKEYEEMMRELESSPLPEVKNVREIDEVSATHQIESAAGHSVLGLHEEVILSEICTPCASSQQVLEGVEENKKELTDATVEEVIAEQTSKTGVNSKDLESNAYARINSMIVLSKDNLMDPMPGSVYVVDTEENKKEKNAILTKKNWNDLIGDTLSRQIGLPPNHYPILIEITSGCDYAQDRQKLPRGIAGFLIPAGSDLTPKFRSAHIKIIGKIFLENLFSEFVSGEYLITINAHYLFGVNRDTIKRLKPSFRIRSTVLTDITTWCANHMSRPGYLQLP